MMKTKKTKKHVFIVDDEPVVRKAIGKTLERLSVEVRCFASGVDCLEQLRHSKCNLLITDVKMPGMDGLELLAEAKRIAPYLKFLVITGYGDIPMAVKATRMGALDFIEKPLGAERLLNAAESALAYPNPSDSLTGRSLTKTEMMILDLILEGKTNREIAEIVSRSIKTVEVHRSHIMRKFGVGNAIDLMKRAIELGLIDFSSNE
ncbi:MAG: response regulator transcription factor [Sedimentisphaerales bacterium]|nr:response regulator transcription factor [Sedimentisphaerales bacterium]